MRCVKVEEIIIEAGQPLCNHQLIQMREGHGREEYFCEIPGCGRHVFGETGSVKYPEGAYARPIDPREGKLWTKIENLSNHPKILSDNNPIEEGSERYEEIVARETAKFSR